MLKKKWKKFFICDLKIKTSPKFFDKKKAQGLPVPIITYKAMPSIFWYLTLPKIFFGCKIRLIERHVENFVEILL